jgi:hypothetical protein
MSFAKKMNALFRLLSVSAAITKNKNPAKKKAKHTYDRSQVCISPISLSDL